ncbi:MAG: M23 family metallopeptidase [Proteobacteria bacterium]|jgi:murein DD-endopeptidase MepM/ murein hydrolase activator NlpD|nr:M23 family metallopeptidase [Pseudomonadota bacterium]
MRHKISIAAICLGAIVFIATVSGADGGSASARVATKLASELGLGTRMAATLLLNGGFPSTWTDAAGGDTRPARLEWPLPGRRLGRGFGSDGGRHEAVDITAPEGTEVRVMAPGIVGYAGDELKGYGDVLLVLHSGGWVTLYAHLSELRARPGQRLVTGEVLGRVGSTGISRGPHLHFELISRGVRIDPMRYMHGAPDSVLRVSSNDGTLERFYSTVKPSSASFWSPMITSTL